MGKRHRIEVVHSILSIIRDRKNSIRVTPLLRSSNLSSQRFSEYLMELIQKGLVKEEVSKGVKLISLTEKGFRYLEKYYAIRNFIEEFDL